MIPVPVNHCKEASGIKITIKDKKFVFSGDCSFSESLIDASKDSELLIHESTFDCRTDREEVLSKGHSDI